MLVNNKITKYPCFVPITIYFLLQTRPRCDINIENERAVERNSRTKHKVTKDENFSTSNIIQLKPQGFNIKLRKGIIPSIKFICCILHFSFFLILYICSEQNYFLNFSLSLFLGLNQRID